MAGLLRTIFFAVWLAGCASEAPLELQPSPSLAPPRAKAASARRAVPKPEIQLDVENNIFFPAGAVQVDADGRRKLQRHAQRLKADPKLELMLVGYTDDQGSRSYKLAVAEQRLESVFKLLRGMGVPGRQLRRYPVGREMSTPGCSDAACLDNMRRVELIYQD
jgi:outer membrane protein OmpA-like peptidoglycan-associated protein